VDEAELQRFIGQEVGRTRVTVERSALANFATAVLDDSPIYRDLTVAQGAGFASIPAPPTFPFVMGHWGAFAEQQPEGAPGPGLGMVLGPLLADGGLILHGEQHFTYERALVAGEVVDLVGHVKDLYVKQSKGATMTFVVVETRCTAAESGELIGTSTSNVLVRK